MKPKKTPEEDWDKKEAFAHDQIRGAHVRGAHVAPSFGTAE
jgi:hypothetical protein